MSYDGWQQQHEEQQQWEEEYGHLVPFEKEFSEFVKVHEAENGQETDNARAKTPF